MNAVTEMLDRFNSRNLRERLLIGGTLLVATYMLWLITLSDSMAQTQREIKRATQLLNSQISVEENEQAALRQRVEASPNDRLEALKAELEAELQSVTATLDQSLSRFVDPEAMALLIEDLIERQPGLELVQLVSLPVQPFRIGDGDPVPGIYRHGMRLRLEGRYFDVIAYLEALENTPWEFGWQRLEYVVEDYPVASVTVEIETLGREPGLIGV